jgi:hypothetical protein
MLMGAMAAAASTCFISARREAKHQTKLVILSSLVLPVGAIDISIIGHEGNKPTKSSTWKRDSCPFLSYEMYNLLSLSMTCCSLVVDP